MGTEKLSEKLNETAGVWCDGPAFPPGGVAIHGIQIRQTTWLAWVVLHESRAS